MASRPASRRHLATSPFARQEEVIPTTDDFHVGDRVVSDRCGMGRVTSVTTEYVTVDFGSEIRRVSPGARGFTRI